MKFTLLAFSLLLVFASSIFGQVPVATQVQILKAEDARRYDSVLEGLMKSPNAAVRVRAALAAGRIGDAAAVPALIRLLQDPSEKVREMAAFAQGETESIEAADAIRIALGETARAQVPGQEPANVKGRLVEAAGKIVAANGQAETRAAASVPDRNKALREAIVFSLERELQSKTEPNKETILLALTAALRARPENAEGPVRKFLAYTDPDIVATALNTLSRLRAKNANHDARDLLETNTHAVVRANAARLLGAAEDKEAVDLLIKAATKDPDSRVRVSAIRSLAALKDQKAVQPLLLATRPMLADVKANKSELLEMAAALGRLLEGKNDAAAIAFLKQLRTADGYSSGETESAFARISAEEYLKNPPPTTFTYKDPWAASAYATGMQTLGTATKDADLQARAGLAFTGFVADMATLVPRANQARMLTAMPDLMRTLAALKPDNLEELMRGLLTNDDVFIRAAAAEILADLPATPENVDALNKAWSKSFILDKVYNDAVLGILDALYKLDKKQASGALLTSLNSRDYLVRKKAFDLLKTYDVKESPGLPLLIESAREKHKDQVLPYSPAFGTRLGQVLNTDVDYRRALSRKNGAISAVFATQKGSFTIEFLPEDAPLTVDNFVKLARTEYFNGLEVHRVVANFVMQDGDPRGDGNGGPGWSIRCEVNMIPYERGAVGMALSGKDTGGSQWFVTHSPQPHLDGGYTVFGRVNETGMKVVDKIVRGDKILSVRIVGR
ncbi:MAG TPA: peptidylprolyl isomerase [Pyrinomonadaceae bacterium]|nr:peptidylprolyl isomerase [Pyrinomonadaceae bacterium]